MTVKIEIYSLNTYDGVLQLPTGTKLLQLVWQAEDHFHLWAIIDDTVITLEDKHLILIRNSDPINYSLNKLSYLFSASSNPGIDNIYHLLEVLP